MFSHYMECGLPAAFRIILPNESSALFWALSPNYSRARIKPSIVVKVINASSGRFSYPVSSKFFMVSYNSADFSEFLLRTQKPLWMSLFIFSPPSTISVITAMLELLLVMCKRLPFMWSQRSLTKKLCKESSVPDSRCLCSAFCQISSVTSSLQVKAAGSTQPLFILSMQRFYR